MSTQTSSDCIKRIKFLPETEEWLFRSQMDKNGQDCLQSTNQKVVVDLSEVNLRVWAWEYIWKEWLKDYGSGFKNISYLTCIVPKNSLVNEYQLRDFLQTVREKINPNLKLAFFKAENEAIQWLKLNS